MTRPTAEARFWAKVDKTEGCWLWTAHVFRDGYAVFRVDGKQVYIHRWAYELLVGPIPDGMQVDHLCRVRHCVRPDHLEPVTPRENSRRAKAANRRTHCQRGHLLDEVRGRRQCRTCKADAERRRYRSKNPVTPQEEDEA
jgi:hypothetical protein